MNIASKNTGVVESPELEKDIPFIKGEPEMMRLRGNKYYGYTSVIDPVTGRKRQIEFALDAYRGEKRKAQINLGKKLEQIDRGDMPNISGSTFNRLAENWKKNPICLEGKSHGTRQYFQILDKTLTPYFGEFKGRDINGYIVKDFLSEREAMGIRENTLRIDLRVLRWVMQAGCKSWKLPTWTFRNKAKVKPDAPYSNDVVLMLGAVVEGSIAYGDQYQDIATISAYTGLDPVDVLNLSRVSIKRKRGKECLTGKRCKSGKLFTIGISPDLKEILTRRTKVVGIDAERKLFTIPSAKSVCQAISRAFDRTGNPQYHAKSLRDYYASELYDQDLDDNFIQDSLGQERGSSETGKYTKSRIEKLDKVANQLPSLGSVSILRKVAK